MISLAIPGFIVGFREGMEAFLIIGIMSRYLIKIQRPELKRSVSLGLYAGIVGSLVFGLALWGLTILVGQAGGAVSKLWESAASLLALILISTLLYWMMRHGKTIVGDVQSEVSKKLSSGGLFALAMIMVLREGAEIALFAFAAVDKQIYLLGVLPGILVAAVLAYLVNRSLVKVNLGIIFNVTLIYLVFQAAYMLGYSVHELLSALKTLGIIAETNPLLGKLFDLSGTVFNHKSGALGVPLNILVGWYSSPERIQFVLQHLYIVTGLALWHRLHNR